MEGRVVMKRVMRRPKWEKRNRREGRPVTRPVVEGMKNVKGGKYWEKNEENYDEADVVEEMSDVRREEKLERHGIRGNCLDCDERSVNKQETVDMKRGRDK